MFKERLFSEFINSCLASPQVALLYFPELSSHLGAVAVIVAVVVVVAIRGGRRRGSVGSIVAGLVRGWILAPVNAFDIDVAAGWILLGLVRRASGEWVPIAISTLWNQDD